MENFVESKLEPTAFYRWILKVTGGDTDNIVSLLKHEILNNQNPQAFDLLAATGDNSCTHETFVKASELIKTLT
ncbi:MAG: hypothetical protein IPP05_21930 [Cytophagaceae bacterium]|nr:hypothetical protein [Cytophagaceae bacterium]